MNTSNLVMPAILLLIALRVWRNGGGRERPIRMARLWILPLIFVAVAGFTIYAQPMALVLTWWTVNVFLVAFALGLGIGWFRGQTTHIAVDPESGDLKARMTPIGLVLIAGLLLIRQSLFDWLNAHAVDWHIAPTAIVDGFMLFALGLILGWRLEMFLRCRRLLSGAAVESS